MDYKELQQEVEILRSEVDELKKLKNIPPKEPKPLIEQINALQTISDERYRIGSKLMLCKIITGMTDATAGTESTHPHYLNKTPNLVLVLPDANGVIYKSKASDSNNIYLKSSANATAFTAFVLY